MTSASRNIRIGFIGFGAVAAAFSARIAEQEHLIYSYDRNLPRENGRAVLEARTNKLPVEFLPLEYVVRRCDLLLSTVPPGQAVSVANEVAAYLCQNNLFVDLTSVSPEKKTDIAEIVRNSGASFVDGVILDSVEAAGADAEILLAGPESARASDLFNECGLRARTVGSEVGQAASLKMLRSICSKGFEALLLEAMLVARALRLDGELWVILEDLFSKSDFPTTAQAWMCTHARAAQRRSEEMNDVVAMIGCSGVDPLVTRGVLSFFERSAALDLGQAPADQSNEEMGCVGALYERLCDGCR